MRPVLKMPPLQELRAAVMTTYTNRPKQKHPRRGGVFVGCRQEAVLVVRWASGWLPSLNTLNSTVSSTRKAGPM